MIFHFSPPLISPHLDPYQQPYRLFPRPNNLSPRPPPHFLSTPPSLSPSLFPFSGREEIPRFLAGAEFAVGAVAEPTSSELVEAVVQDFAEEKEMPLLAQ